MVSGITAPIMGSLVSAQLAEVSHPVNGVAYQNVGNILVSKFRMNRPSLSEWTSGQARILPVISQPYYLLDTAAVQA